MMSEKAYSDKPFKRQVCTYHKRMIIKDFDRMNRVGYKIKYDLEKLNIPTGYEEKL